MSQAPAKGVSRFDQVVDKSESRYADRPLFLIQHPEDDTKFLRFHNKTDATDHKDRAERRWDVLPAVKSENNNSMITSQFLLFGAYDNDGYASLALLPQPRDNNIDGSAYAYIINYKGDGINYYFRDEPDWNGDNNDRVLMSSDGLIKYRNGRYFTMSGDSTTSSVSTNVMKCRFLKAKDLTTGNFTTPSGEMADGSAVTVDFAQAIKADDKKDAIKSDFEQDNGPCPHNMITTEIEGRENCTKYYGVDNVWPLSDGTKGALAPDADVVIPETILPSLGEQYDINRYLSGQKFLFRTFYFINEENATSRLKAYLSGGGTQAIDNPERKKLYGGVSTKVCGYDDNVLFSFSGPDDENTNCDQVINDEEKILSVCTSNAAIRMNTGNTCSKSYLGDDRWQQATARYCGDAENKITDPRCKMYLAHDASNIDTLCGTDSNVWTPQCKDIMEGRKAIRKQFKKDKKDGTVLTGMTEEGYVLDRLSRDFHEKWKSENPDWNPPGYVLPDMNFCQTNIDVVEQNAGIKAACEINNYQGALPGADDDGDGAPLDDDSGGGDTDGGDTDGGDTDVTEDKTIKITANSSSTIDQEKGGGIVAILCFLSCICCCGGFALLLILLSMNRK